MTSENENHSIEDLVTTHASQRDEIWEQDFLRALPYTRLQILDSAPHAGPDGWPYLMVETHTQGHESADRLLKWLSERGIGLVINPRKEAPDYVLSYGMIWNHRETGRFITPVESATPHSSQPGQVKFEKGQGVLAGAPSEQYLPEYVRIVLRSFFRDNGIAKMRWLVLSEDRKHYDLCFSLEALGHPAPEEHRGILEGLSWFLPAHYSLVLVSEDGLPPFHDL